MLQSGATKHRGCGDVVLLTQEDRDEDWAWTATFSLITPVSEAGDS